MPASFLHGVEVIELATGPAPITVVKSSVIGLVGTAPSWALAPSQTAPGISTPTLVSSAQDAAKFGPAVQGYTIPYALNAMLNQGAGQAIVVNVFDITKHTSDIVASQTFSAAGAVNLGHMGITNLSVMPTTTAPITGESHTFAGTPATIQLAHGNVQGSSIVVTSNPAGTTYIQGTDYSVDTRTGLAGVYQQPASDYSLRSHIPRSRRLEVALRPPERNGNTIHGPAIPGESSASNRYEGARAQIQTPEAQGDRHGIRQRVTAPRNLFSPGPESVRHSLRLTAIHQLPLRRRHTSSVTSGNSKVSGGASQSSGRREIIRPLINLWEGVNRLVRAIRPSLGSQTLLLARSSAGTPIAPTDHSLSKGKLTAGRANGYLRSLPARESSHPSSSKARNVDQRLSHHRLNSTVASRMLSNTLTTGSPAARLVAQLRGRRSAPPQTEFAHPTRTQTRISRFSDNSGDMRNPFTVNFSPTVVVQSESQHGSIEGKVVDAIRRHSHELVRLIDRELQMQRRAVF